MLKNFSEECFDIIIQAGQSNSEGYGFGAVKEPFEPKDTIWYLNQDFTISKACEKVSGNGIQSNFSLSFADRYIENGLLKEGRKLLIIRAAVGGTGFLDNRWKPEDDLFLQMIEMIKTAAELNRQNRFVALLWHQGETDATLNADYDTHYKNLSTLVNLTRDTVGNQNLPFIAGDFVSHWKNDNIEICTPVVKAIMSVCNDIGNAGFTETSGLISNNEYHSDDVEGWIDTIHFCRQSTKELGDRYFDVFKSIINHK